MILSVQMGMERNTVFPSNFGKSVCFSTGSLTSQRPILGVGLGMKRVKQNRRLSSRMHSMILFKAELAGSIDGLGLLEKDFEFKPSFDDYLKTMESIKDVREKKKLVHNPNRNESIAGSRKKDSSRTVSVENGEGNINKNKDFKRVEFKGQRNTGKDHASVNGRLGSTEENMDVSFRRKLVVDNRKKGWEDNKTIVKERRSNYEFEKNTSKISRQSFIGLELRETIEMVDHVQVEKVSYKSDGRKNRKPSWSSRTAPNYNIDDDDDDDSGGGDGSGALGMDRAAFKSLDEYDGVYDNPRVSQVDMEARIQKLAKSLNGADIDMPEWMFSKMMRSARIRFSDHSMLRIIQILGKLGNWKRVLQVIEWIQCRERFKSHKIRYIYTAALDALNKARRPVEALNLFQEMQQYMSTYPDLVAYHCIAVTLGQAGHMKELFDVIDIMRSPPKKKFKIGVLQKWDPRLEPDIVVYNAVLNACVRRKKWEGAFWVLQQIKQQSLQPSSSTYGLVMEVMFACGKYNLVHDFFKKVQKSSISNALTYKVLVNTLWREGKIDEAALAVQDMEKRGIIGTSGLYYDLARCLCSAGRCHEALMQVEKICKVANKPLVVTYTGLIQCCLDAGNIQNGAYLFNHMLKFCSPNLVTCNIMLKGYLDHGMLEDAKDMFKKLLDNSNCIRSESDYKDKVIPDNYTFNLMLDACAAGQMWDDLEFVYKRMLQHGYHFNPKRHLQLILDAARAGKMELLETTWKHLSQANRAPPAILIKEMFRVRLEHGDCVAALSCLSGYSLDDMRNFSPKSWLKFFMENSHCFGRDTLSGLVHEVSIHISKSNSPSLVFKNLLSSCKEILRTRMKLPEIDQSTC